PYRSGDAARAARRNLCPPLCAPDKLVPSTGWRCVVMTESGDLASKRKSCASSPFPTMTAMSQGGGDRDLFLKRSRDIEYAKKHGSRISTALFTLVICRTDVRDSRVGIVVGKRFGGAVKIGRASCRERVWGSVVEGAWKRKG